MHTRDEENRSFGEYGGVKILRHPDGRSVTLLERGNDESGPFLRIKHQVPRQGVMNAPHWHPVLTESFEVKQGLMQFHVNGVENVLGSGERITIYPKQVHHFSNVGEVPLIGVHEIRPPGLHWEMFALHHKLECEGKLNQSGVPYNPLWLGVIWKYGDGYLASPPAVVQKVVLGGLAHLAKVFGYRI